MTSAESTSVRVVSWRDGGCEGVRLRECGRVQEALWLELEKQQRETRGGGEGGGSREK